jgi:hypothetical protein
MRRLRVTLGILAITALAAVPATASAAPASTTFVVQGAETGFTSTSASFAGTGIGDQGDRATWRTSITRTPFNPAGQSTITGGTFSMTTLSPSWTPDRVRGTVAGGFVEKTSGFSGCTNETFAVTLSLIDVATSSTTGGTGSFVGQLTHHRTVIFGACRPYFATIRGVVTLAY